MPISDILKTVIDIKNPITLLAFFSVILLLAFRTRQVSKRFLDLLSGMLTKEQFYQLLNRALLCGSVAFLLVCSVDVVGQVLDYKAKVAPISAEEHKSEIQRLQSSVRQDESATQQAISAYQQGMAHFQQKEFDQAIQSIQVSLERYPTLSAQFTLAYLYAQTGDDANARKYLDGAAAMAHARGSKADLGKIEQLKTKLDDRGSLVGEPSELPNGGSARENAPLISPGLYVQNKYFGEPGSNHYFKFALKADQILTIRFRTPEAGGFAAARIYDRDGGTLSSGSAAGASNKTSVSLRATKPGTYYLNLNSSITSGTVYRVSVH